MKKIFVGRCFLRSGFVSAVFGALMACLPISASATPSFVGQFNVFDGPSLQLAPQSLSARQVAALLFGGVFTDYAISVVDSQDWQTVTHTAWLDGFSDNTHLLSPAGEDFVGALASGKYDDVGAFSAWVCDHADCVADGYPTNAGWDWAGYQYTNYVWRLDVPVGQVSEPGSLALGGLGFLLMGVTLVRRRQAR